MTGRKGFAGWTLGGALLLLVAGAQPWVTGHLSDSVLGGAALQASGSQVASGVVALALVAAAALVGVLTGGRAARAVSAAVLTVAALGVAGLVLSVGLDPVSALGRHAATLAGRSSVTPADATTGPGLWVAGAGSLALLVAAALAWRGVRRWSGLTARYERTAGAAADRGAVRSAWDELTEGRDPTISGGPAVAEEDRAAEAPTEGASDGRSATTDRDRDAGTGTDLAQ